MNNNITSLSWCTEKTMAPHSSPLAWKIPWMEEPGGLQSMGSLRVGHDWSDLAAAAGVTWYIKCGWWALLSPKTGKGKEISEGTQTLWAQKCTGLSRGMIVTPAAYYNLVISHPLPHMKIQSAQQPWGASPLDIIQMISPAWKMKYLWFSNYASLEVTEQVNKLKNMKSSLQSGSSPPLHYLLLSCCLGMYKLTILSYAQFAKLMVLFLSSALKTLIHPSKPRLGITSWWNFPGWSLISAPYIHTSLECLLWYCS